MSKPIFKTPRECAECGATFVARYAKYCPRCLPTMRRSKPKKYRLDAAGLELLRARYDSRVKGRVAELAATLRVPGWWLKKEARSLGLAKTVDRRDWTAEELVELETWAGVRSAGWIGRRLGRPELSVINKLKRMEISRRVREGYSVRDLARCFGVDDHVVARWVRLGWIRPTVPNGADRYTRYHDTTLLQFIRQHPLEFRLDKVDQVWFLGLVLGAPIDEASATRLTTANNKAASIQREKEPAA